MNELRSLAQGCEAEFLQAKTPTLVEIKRHLFLCTIRKESHYTFRLDVPRIWQVLMNVLKFPKTLPIRPSCRQATRPRRFQNTLATNGNAYSSMAKKAAYVVRIGRIPGIYFDYAECKKQVDGFSGAKHQGYFTREAAKTAWDDWLDSAREGQLSERTASSLGVPNPQGADETIDSQKDEDSRSVVIPDAAAFYLLRHPILAIHIRRPHLSSVF